MGHRLQDVGTGGGFEAPQPSFLVDPRQFCSLPRQPQNLQLESCESSPCNRACRTAADVSAVKKGGKRVQCGTCDDLRQLGMPRRKVVPQPPRSWSSLPARSSAKLLPKRLPGLPLRRDAVGIITYGDEFEPHFFLKFFSGVNEQGK